MITEYFDESLVLLRRLLNLELDDVVYFKLKKSLKPHAAGSSVEHMSHQVRNFNNLDSLLYDHFNQTLWRRIAAERAFWPEVEELRKRQEKSSQVCSEWL